MINTILKQWIAKDNELMLITIYKSFPFLIFFLQDFEILQT